jgi:hypothetical protein
VKDGSPVRILDATDEQFEMFIREVGMPVKAGAEGEKWSFDNRCRAINYALKHRLHLPFVDINNSDTEQKASISPAELQASIRGEPGVIDIPGAPTFSALVNIFKGVMTGEIATDEHPLEPVVPSGGRDYPDVGDEEVSL